MTSALPDPSFAGLLTAWTWQPVAIVVAALLAAWYASAVRRVRRSGRTWSAGRVITFTIGIAAFVWTTCGFTGAYLDSLFWVWTTQQLALLLVVPYFIMAGGPLQLARLVHGPDGLADRFLRSGVVKVLGNPLVAPALVPLLSIVLFFGPLPGWAVDVPQFGWFEQVVVLGIGALIVLPLVGADAPRSSLAVGLSLAIGSFELVLDAVPGIALRLHNNVSTSFFDYRAVHPWSPSGIHDQQTAGSVLWCVSELLDLPFLILVFVQWIKADARDAAQVDAVLEAERIARGQAEPSTEGEPGPTDEPWWVSDPSMQNRLRRPY